MIMGLGLHDGINGFIKRGAGLILCHVSREREPSVSQE